MLRQLLRKIIFSRPFRLLLGWSQSIALPGFEGFSIYQISKFFFQALRKGDLINRAAAISFKVFLAFFPSVIVLVTFIPFIPIENFQAQLLTTIGDVLPREVYLFIETTLHDLVVKKHTTLLSISFLIAIYLASNSIDAILQGFGGSYNHTQYMQPWKRRLWSLGLLFALTITSIAAILLITIGDLVVSFLFEKGLLLDQIQVYGLLFINWLGSLLLVLTSIALLFHAGDPTRRKFRLFRPGTVLATLLVLLVSKGLAYVFSNVTDYNALYGSIGVILAVQLWIYITMIVILIGYELNISISRARGERTRILRVQRQKQFDST